MSDYSHLPQEDQKLIEAAKHKVWWEINPEEAKSEEAKSILHNIAVREYHRDERRAGIL